MGPPSQAPFWKASQSRLALWLVANVPSSFVMWCLPGCLGRYCADAAIGCAAARPSELSASVVAAMVMVSDALAGTNIAGSSSSQRHKAAPSKTCRMHHSQG